MPDLKSYFNDDAEPTDLKSVFDSAPEEKPAAPEAAPFRLNLKAAPTPQVDWRGVTEHVLQAENQIKSIQEAKVSVGLSPDVFPEGHYQDAVGKFLDKVRAKSAVSGNPMTEAVDTFKEDVLDPEVIRPLQENYGRPLLDKYISARKSLVGEESPESELLGRSALQPLAGKPQLKMFGDSKRGTDAANNLDQKLGTSGAAFAQGVAQYGGETPLFLIGGPETGVLKVGTDGLVAGLIIPDAKPSEMVAGNAVMHGAVTSLGKVLEALKPAASEAVAGVKSIFAKKPEPSAAAWERVSQKGAKAEVPPPAPRLAAVITKDGLATVADEVAAAPVTPKPPAGPKVLGAGRPSAPKPVMSVATIDAATGEAIIKRQHADGSVSSEPLTVESGLAAYRAGYTTVASDLASAWAKGDFGVETDAFMGLRQFKEGDGHVSSDLLSGYRRITPADLDYSGSHFKPDGAELYTGGDGPKITPVFVSDVRLPDEVDPVYLGEPTELSGIPTRGERAPVLDPTVISNTRAQEVTRNERMPGQTIEATVSDFRKRGQPVIMGGAGKPPRRYGTGGTPDAPTSPDEVDNEFLPVKGTPELNVYPPHPGDRELESRLVKWKSPVQRNASGTFPDETAPSEFKWKNPAPARGASEEIKARRNAPVSPDEPADNEFLRIKGPAVPEKPAVLQGAPTPENTGEFDLATLDGVMKNVRQLQVDKSGVDKVLGFMVGRHLRGPTDLATMVTSIQAANQLAKSADDLRLASRALINKDMMSKASLDLHKFAEGELSASEFFGRNPELSARAREFSRDMFDEKEEHDRFFQSVGVVPEELGIARDEGAIPLYVSRRFWSRLLPPGAWGKKLQAPGMEDVLEKGVKQIYDDMLKSSPTKLFTKTEGGVRTNEKRPTVSEDEIALEVVKVINAEDPVAAFRTSFVGKPYSALMAKNRKLPGTILDLLGEVKSGTVSLPYTLGMQRANRARYTLMDEVANNFSSDRPDVARGMTYQLPDNGAMFAAKGRFVPQAIFEALGNGPKITESSHQLLHSIQRLVKGHQVVGGLVGPHLNSLMDNIKGGVLSGGLDLTRPVKTGASAWQAAQALLHYGKDPTGKTGYGAIVLDAKRAGADYFGFGHEEINNPASLKFMKDLNLAFPDPKGNILSQTTDLLMRTMKGYQRGLAWAGGALDWVDRLFRLQSYIALQDKFLADLAKNGDASALVREGLVPAGLSHQGAANEVRGMKYNLLTKAELNSPQRLVHEMASRLATRRINQSFWNPTFVGNGVDKLRKSAVGVVTPYATAVFENWRVNGGIPLRLKQEPDLKWRLLTHALIAGGASGIAIAASGVSHKEIQEAEGEMPKGRQTYKPATFPLTWHDDKGRVQFWNATSWSEVTRLMQGDVDDPMLNRVLSNLVMSPFQGGLAEQPLRSGFEAAGVLSPVRPPAPTGAQTGGLALLQYLHSAGAFPTFTKGVVDAARRVPELRPIGQAMEDTKLPYVEPLGEMIGRPKSWEEALTPVEGALKAVGMTNAEPVTSGKKDYLGRQNPSRQASDLEAARDLGKHGTQQKAIKSVAAQGGSNAKAKEEALMKEQKSQIQKYFDSASQRKK